MSSETSKESNSRRLARTWPYPRHNDFVRLLREAATVWFKDHRYVTNDQMSYCLDKWENWRHNIIIPEVARYIAETKKECNGQSKPFPLHKYVHHGLSSQAMCFNLLGPLVVQGDLSPLKIACESAGVNWPADIADPQFEYEKRDVFKEDAGQPTSIDFVMKDRTGTPRIFIECKLVEQEFGGCSVFAAGDCDGRNPVGDYSGCYLHYIGRRYWELLEKHGFIPSMKTERQCVLAIHYQFFRELIFSLEHDGVFILLSDERSPVFHCKGNGTPRGIMPFLTQFVPDAARLRIASISIQSLLESIKVVGSYAWVSEFEKKYGLGTS